MTYRILLFLCLLTITADSFFGMVAYEEKKTLLIEDKNWKIYQIHNLEAKSVQGKKLFLLKENAVSNGGGLDDLVIDFEKRNLNLPNYKVIHENFQQNKYQSVNGSFSGKFFYSDHYISLLPLSTSIFAPGNVCGSFTIEFWVYFYKNYDNQYIIRYVGNNLSDEEDRNTYGISIYTKNNKLIYEFDNIFWSSKNEPYSVTMDEDEPIRYNEWEHHAITYNIMNGKIVTYKNGVEQKTKWITENNKILSPIFSPIIKRELSTPILIGKGGFFSLDNLKITKDTLSDFNLKKYRNQPANLTTDVYKISENIASMKKLSFGYDSPKHGFIKLGYRIADYYFNPNDDMIPWVYIQNNIENFPADYNKGKFIQFSVQVFPYEDMNEPLAIHNIRLDYADDSNPDVPIITAIEPHDGAATITWIPATETDIVGYELYYGNKSGHYICRDSIYGQSPIFITNTQLNSIAPLSYQLKGLINEKPYFIALRSIDKNGHRSQYSKEFYVRPSTVYNQDNYSIDK